MGRVVLLGAAIAVAACSVGGSGSSSPGPTVPDTGPTSDLAPSQVTAVTAAPPDTPPPCHADDVTLWTAQVLRAEPFADAVIRVRNDGPSWCEVDVAGSPLLDPAMEFDVWLDPGAWADLVVGPLDGDCSTPATVDLAQVDVNGTQVVVPTAAVVPCGWRLTAFFPNRVSDEPCREVAAVAVERAIVVRNDGNEACRLGALETVVGEGVTTTAVAPDIEVPVLAAGDVVAFALDRIGAAGEERTLDLEFDAGPSVEVAVDGTVSVGVGPPQPWLGGAIGPDADDPAELLASIEPFPDGT